MSGIEQTRRYAAVATLDQLRQAEENMRHIIATEKNPMVRSSYRARLTAVQQAIAKRHGMPAATQANCNASTGM